MGNISVHIELNILFFLKFNIILQKYYCDISGIITHKCQLETGKG